MAWRRAGMLTMAAVLIWAAAGATSVAEAQGSADCRTTGSFSSWLAAFRREAAQKGVSERTLSAALDGVQYDAGIIRRDRGQKFFGQSFSDFSGRLVSSNRLKTGARKLQQRASLFREAEARYGVPGPIITAFWALESDFGAGTSKQGPVFDSLATLAYDCRRPELFRDQLLAALEIIDRKYLTLDRMTGSWAGELGQTQFLPTHYRDFAVDADGDGARDLIRSDADIIFSTANYIKHLGWRRGEPWLEEVRAPREMPWDQADLEILHPRSKWAAWGVRRADGGALANDGLEASLVLPMGREGPAFLAYPNFRIYTQWNQSLNYALTAAYLATRLDGAPKMGNGWGTPENYGYKDIMELQRLLARRGYDVGKIDGILGSNTRAAIKDVQKKTGLPADSYPSPELFARLR